MKDLKTFDDLFSGDCLFRIPNYQRGYAWQRPQINDFWEDLINLRKQMHYTGMITIKKLKKKDVYNAWREDQWALDAGFTPYHVVDGQQRITTVVILINSMVQYAKQKGYDSIASTPIQEIQSKYLFREFNKMKSFIFGYEVDNPSFMYLKFRILDSNEQESVDESYYTNNLCNAK